MRFYRLTLLACVTAWFLLGLHVPTLHHITGHGAHPSLTVLAAVTLLIAVGVSGLWMLLRAPRSDRA